MPLSKLKNMILVILAVTNLCLLGIVAGQVFQNRQMEARARENAVRFLGNRGVEVEESKIPQEMDLPPLTVERDMEGEERTAAALLQGTVAAEARGGEVYRYDNGNGSVQFHSDGTVSAQLNPDAYPLGADWTAGCVDWMEKAGFSGRVLEVSGDRLTFRQTLQGSPLFSHQVVLTCQEGGLTAITAGRLLVGRPQEDASRTVITVATALMDFLNGVNALGDVCNRIDGMEPGYVSAASLSGTTVLTPVWRMTTDTGTYYLDTVTGGVTRAS